VIGHAALDCGWWTIAAAREVEHPVDAPLQVPLITRLLHLGVVSLSSPDVLRFMGKKVTRQGNAAGGLKPPLSSDLKTRSNGARVQHRLGPNQRLSQSQETFYSQRSTRARPLAPSMASAARYPGGTGRRSILQRHDSRGSP